MGLTETLWESASLGTIVSLVIGYIAIKSIIFRMHEQSRIQSLGGRAPAVASYVPFHIDIIYKAVKASRIYKVMEMWRDELFGKAGSWTVEANILGDRMIFTADPENMKAILATQFSDYGKGDRFHREWRDFLGDSIFTTDGAMWHDSRQLIRPQFSRDRVSDLECFETHVQTLLKAIANGGALDGEDQHVDMANANGRVVDISEIFFRYTLDVATEFLFDNDVKSLTTPQQDFADAFHDVQEAQTLKIRLGFMGEYLPQKSFRNGLKVMNKFVNRFIQSALRLSQEELSSKAKSDKDYSFLHALASFTQDPKVLRDQLVATLLAGRDTTAGTLSWTLYELARNPQVVAKFRKEILETLGPNKTPTYEDLKNMTYLKAIMNETLRLYPAVPLNVRVALKDTTLPRGGGPDGSGPVGIPKDTRVAYSTLVMQRRADLYPPISEDFADPALFSPDRWLHWYPKPHEYSPFNAGPRICVGQQFALTEMGYTLCRLFQRFETVTSHMEEIDGGSPALKAQVTLSPAQGVFVSFHEPAV